MELDSHNALPDSAIALSSVKFYLGQLRHSCGVRSSRTETSSLRQGYGGQVSVDPIRLALSAGIDFARSDISCALGMTTRSC